MTDFRLEKLGDLQQVISCQSVCNISIFGLLHIIQCMHNTCTMEPLNVDSLKKDISHIQDTLFCSIMYNINLFLTNLPFIIIV